LPSPTIRAVLFDFGQVLSGPPDPAVWVRLHTILHADEPSFCAAYWAHRHDYDRGTLNAVTYWQAVARDLGQTLTTDQQQQLIAADVALWTQPNQAMIDFATGLQRRGIRTGILSNIGDAMEAGILAHFPFLQQFDHHTFSHRLKIAKPEAAIYAYAAAGLGTAPAKILFLDDREENILAARAAGMIAIRYSSHAAFLKELRALGLDDLLGLELLETGALPGEELPSELL
jgi:putative hydrolase of the HAD superfamily